jgi:DNA-binding transcriptional MocR family regulator
MVSVDTLSADGYPQEMPPDFSKRSLAVEPFLAMEVMERALAMEREGTSVLHLEIGEPETLPPAVVIEACSGALAAGETRYTDSRGLHELRQAIAVDYDRRFGVSVDPDRVLVTSGTSPGMLLVLSSGVRTTPAIRTSCVCAVGCRSSCRQRPRAGIASIRPTSPRPSRRVPAPSC